MKWYVRFYEYSYLSRRFVVRSKVMIASGSSDIVRQLGPEYPLISIERMDDENNFHE